MQKPEKHPKDMTTEELARYLFGDDAYEALKRIAHEQEAKPKTPKSPRRKSST